MARPPIYKSGPMTRTEYQRRWRAKLKKRKKEEAKRAKLRAQQEQRAERERMLATKQLALPIQKFGVILEDFEWDFQVRNRETGMGRHAANHYPVAEEAHTAEEIVSYTADRFTLAADDCVLFMCVTVPYLAIGVDVLRLRGFRYASGIFWDKEKWATGYWTRNEHEHVLIGVKGNIPAPAQGTQWSSVIREEATEHSRKPEKLYRFIEEFYPTLPKIELNCRGVPRPGWHGWGYEAVPARTEGR
jgi:N6-adenosine-specific RNA methylase IME4